MRLAAGRDGSACAIDGEGLLSVPCDNFAQQKSRLNYALNN
jgi:hypothetical protein